MALEAQVSLRAFRRGDTDALVALWHACGLTRPWNDPHRDIKRKLAVDPELLVVGERGDEIVASIMIGYEGHRGWINYLSVAPGCQRQGIGRRLMAHAEEALRSGHPHGDHGRTAGGTGRTDAALDDRGSLTDELCKLASELGSGELFVCWCVRVDGDSGVGERLPGSARWGQ